MPFVQAADTSRAARAVAQRTEKSKLQRVKEFYVQQRRIGATSDEVERVLGIKHQSMGTIMLKLRADGFIVERGDTRTTRSGCEAKVYIMRGAV